MASFIGVLLLALSLGMTGARKAPSPSAGQALVYAPQEADHMVFLNVAAVAPAAIEAARGLLQEPFIKEFPEVYEGARAALQGMDMGLGMAKTRLGFDPSQDLDYLVAWVKHVENGPPDFLLVVRGRLGDDPLGKFAQMLDVPVSELRGRPAVSTSGLLMMHGADGALLFGSAAWVEERSLATWTGRRPTGVSAHAAPRFKEKPFLLLASEPSDAARRLIAPGMPGAELALFRALATEHEHLSLWLSGTGLGWEWAGRDKASFANAHMASDGLIELLRAGQIAMRGLVRLALAGLSPYTAENTTLARLLNHKERILELVLGHTGDGAFEAKVTANAGKRLVQVVARAKSLDQILPVGGVLPLVGAGAAWFVVRRSAPMEPTLDEAPAQPAGPETERVREGKEEAPDPERVEPAPAP